MSAAIRALEELSLNAWPAQQTLLLDGWLLRFADGYTRRANSVQPLYPSSGAPLEDKIAACEELYRQQGLPVIFKLTPASQPAELDARLEGLGYRREADTSVQTLDLASYAAPGEDASLTLQASLSEEWLALYGRMSASRPEQLARHRAILAAIQPDACYAALSVEGVPAACGLAVRQSGWVGIYDILVDPAQRRRGLGLRLVRALLGWGARGGARDAYLQVMQNNPPALALYAKLGFSQSYPYWYRVK